jgi:hypothetical protein
MQVPTPDSDNNPYHVFRQRTKPNKPQTRRRRETQEESLEKLRSIRENLSQALSIAEMVREREHKKHRWTVCCSPVCSMPVFALVSAAVQTFLSMILLHEVIWRFWSCIQVRKVSKFYILVLEASYERCTFSAHTMIVQMPG